MSAGFEARLDSWHEAVKRMEANLGDDVTSLQADLKKLSDIRRNFQRGVCKNDENSSEISQKIKALTSEIDHLKKTLHGKIGRLGQENVFRGNRKAKEVEDIQGKTQKKVIVRRARAESLSPLDAAALREVAMLEKDSVLWKCVDRVPGMNGGYLYHFRLREEYDPSLCSSPEERDACVERLFQKAEEIEPAGEPISAGTITRDLPEIVQMQENGILTSSKLFSLGAFLATTKQVKERLKAGNASSSAEPQLCQFERELRQEMIEIFEDLPYEFVGDQNWRSILDETLENLQKFYDEKVKPFPNTLPEDFIARTRNRFDDFTRNCIGLTFEKEVAEILLYRDEETPPIPLSAWGRLVLNNEEDHNFFHALGYNYGQPTLVSYGASVLLKGQTDVLTLPDREALLGNWRVEMEKDPTLQDFDILDSAGVATDLAFIEAYMTHRALLSDGKEFIHDHLNHVGIFIQSLLLFRKLGKNIDQEKAGWLRILLDPYRVLMLMKYNPEKLIAEEEDFAAQEDLKEIQALIDGKNNYEVALTAFGWMVDVFTSPLIVNYAQDSLQEQLREMLSPTSMRLTATLPYFTQKFGKGNINYRDLEKLFNKIDSFIQRRKATRSQ